MAKTQRDVLARNELITAARHGRPVIQTQNGPVIAPKPAVTAKLATPPAAAEQTQQVSQAKHTPAKPGTWSGAFNQLAIHATSGMAGGVPTCDC